jgi:uroporphyrinogen decarboxylase
MQGSRERVRRVLAFEKPDRAPIFDLIRNDAILTHFNDGVPVAPGDNITGVKAISKAVDATRGIKFAPAEEHIEKTADGREVRIERWTTWTEPDRSLISAEEYCTRAVQELENWRERAQPIDLTNDPGYLHAYRELQAAAGNDFSLSMSGPKPGIMHLWSEYGIENFSYLVADCEAVMAERLEYFTDFACRWVMGLPADDPMLMLFVGEDMAFKTGPLINPKWTRRFYFPQLKKFCDAVHAKGKKVLFHSDGNLNAVMDDIVAAGVDVLNPIEVLAGMNIADLHRRYPRLIFAGGIDVSQLLPFGTPQQVRDATIKAIEDAEGHILVGSSTELHNDVPLANFLALREAAMGYVF